MLVRIPCIRLINIKRRRAAGALATGRRAPGQPLGKCRVYIIPSSSLLTHPTAAKPRIQAAVRSSVG